MSFQSQLEKIYCQQQNPFYDKHFKPIALYGIQRGDCVKDSKMAISLKWELVNFSQVLSSLNSLSHISTQVLLTHSAKTQPAGDAAYGKCLGDS